MLRLIIGKAGTGKTSAVTDEIKRSVDAEKPGNILIVPEQYSHEAERELCRRCGDTVSLYAEVLSFTALARKVASQRGGNARPWLDKGGRLLCMALALQSIGPRMKVYGAAQRKAELQAMLLNAVDEFKTACIGSDELIAAAGECRDSLGDKLSDMALILEAYNAAVANGHADPGDRLTMLREQIEGGAIAPGTKIYVDGFTDFTMQEQEILASMLRARAELTVCLTLDSLQSDNEVFSLARRAGQNLCDCARELGIEPQITVYSKAAEDAKPIGIFTENMFSYSALTAEDNADSIRLYRAESVSCECEQAAARCLELVRGGARWRDIAVCVRGFEDYRSTLESVFENYGVPLFTARKSDLMSKPLPALVSLAYEIRRGGWDVDDVVSYMRTGLSGLETAECDELEDYIFKWQLKAAAWLRKTDWNQHPDGYGAEYDDESRERLAHINALRYRLSKPLIAFCKDADEADTALGQAKALAGLFEALGLPNILSQRAEELLRLGQDKLAAEYRQLWDIIVSALEQCATVLGDTPMGADDFGRLFTLMLSKYDIGTIPVALDRVTAGDFDRNRRRGIKHLIVLGTSDQRLPRAEESAGVFSLDERRRLSQMNLELSAGGDSELWREFSLIYNCLSMPSETLTMSCPTADNTGAELRCSLVFNRAAAIFNKKVLYTDITDVRLSSLESAAALAGQSLGGAGAVEAAAAEYFRNEQPERFAVLEAASKMQRGKLSASGVERLYGRKLKLSASRIDKFASCRFAYFCQYGLKAKPYEPAGFKPPEIGTFMHHVLEMTAKEVKSLGGFKNVDDAKLREITQKYIDEYIRTELNDFSEKSGRFVYLFRRICADTYKVVEDMAQELRNSDFEPLDFELDFSKASEIPPTLLGSGEDSLQLTGIADRIDGYVHDGKLYLRVVDYKTGHKKFSLSDVWYGMGLQMLLYLFALEASGEKRYDMKIASAGIMYIPARNNIISLSAEADDESIGIKHAEELRRSGLVLDDPAIIEAWEHGSGKKYIPFKINSKRSVADSVADAEKLGILQRHIDRELTKMAKMLRAGSISADPYYKSQQETACLNCDYFDACHFADGQNGEKSRYIPKISAEKVWTMMEEAENNE